MVVYLVSDQEKFRQIFASRYSLPLPPLFQGSLDEALMSSLYDPTNVNLSSQTTNKSRDVINSF